MISFVDFMREQKRKKRFWIKYNRFTSFVLPLMLIPLAVKGVQEIAKVVKKRKEKAEKEK